ncbi:hypothetical protein [Pseudomonas aeruginosa]|uniref:hypothetical protein n=1 Tax=Pseudomonas aeruginosa TaxID=287 RepID=UPI001BD5A9AE|nr:hypothetical protein [Pseudomonas aeruginosa]MBS9730373.1 hypothetical protein [Pseudomonas aeruginosa]
MDSVVLTEEDGNGYEIPDLPHIGIVYDALNDTLDQVDRGVAGTESLTASQQYLVGALVANRPGYSVAGNEGFMANIGAGLKAAYEYVVKMFKSLWDFFFKRDVSQKTSDAKKEIDDLQTKLEVVQTGGKTEAETQEALHSMKAQVKEQAQSGFKIDGVDAEEWVEKQAKTSATHEEKKAAVKTLARELPKVNTRGKKRLQGVIERMIKTQQYLVSVIDVADKEARETLNENLMRVTDSMKLLRTNVHQSTEQLSRVKDVKDLTAVHNVMNGVIKEIDTFKNAAQAVQSVRGKMADKIKIVEQQLAEVAKGGGDTKATQAALDELRKIMNFLVKCGKCITNIIEDSVKLQKAFNGVFGL